ACDSPQFASSSYAKKCRRLPRDRLSAGRHSREHVLQAGRGMNKGVRSAAITSEQLAAVRRSEWFGTLEPGFQRALLASSRVMVLAAGEAVFYRGDPCDGIYCVLSGAVRFGAVSPSGRESVVALVEGPEWFGEIALFDGGVRTHDVWADVASTVLHLPMRHL